MIVRDMIRGWHKFAAAKIAAFSMVGITLLASTARAQPASANDSTKPLADSRLFIHSDLYVLATFGVGTVAMFPLDKHLASVIRDEDLVTNRNLEHAASLFRFFGGSGPFLIGGAMYVVGRAAGIPRAAHVAVHGTEAVVVGTITSAILKTVLGRARPYISADTNPRSFVFGRGFRNGTYQSFPSGHSTNAFAVAAAVTSETSEWWPKYRWVIGTVLYGGATMVGLSRMYDDKHWASDVVMGAAVGTFAGLKTVRFNHTHTGNRVDRWLLGGSSPSSVKVGLGVLNEHTVGVVGSYRW